MELLCPACVGIHLSHHGEEAVLILAHLIVAELLASHGLLENRLNLRVGVLLVVELLNTVVGELGALGLEELVALLQGIDHISELRDADAADVGKLLDILGELRLLDVHSLVGTPGGQHDGIVLSLALGILDVVVQVVNGVVGGADALHIVMLHQATGRKLRLLQLLIALVENLAGGLWREQFLDAKGSLQFQMGPMVERVAQGVGNGLCPLLELLPVGSVLAGAVALVDAVGTHGTPLIVVTAKPQLGDALELMVVGHHLGNQVAMVVDNRHLGRMVVVQVLGNFCLQHKILVVKCFHKFVSF